MLVLGIQLGQKIFVNGDRIKLSFVENEEKVRICITSSSDILVKVQSNRGCDDTREILPEEDGQFYFDVEVGQPFWIAWSGESCKVVVAGSRGNYVRFGFEAPRRISVNRETMYYRKLLDPKSAKKIA